MAYDGSLCLLKIKEGNEDIVIGGLKTTKFSLNNQIIDCSNKTSGKWRKLLPEAGISSLTIAGNGVFTDSKAEHVLKKAAFDNATKTFTLKFANNDFVQGTFHIVNYERHGNFKEEESYSIILESSGWVRF